MSFLLAFQVPIQIKNCVRSFRSQIRGARDSMKISEAVKEISCVRTMINRIELCMYITPLVWTARTNYRYIPHTSH